MKKCPWVQLTRTGRGCLTPETSQETSHQSQEPSVPACPLCKTSYHLPATTPILRVLYQQQGPKGWARFPSAWFVPLFWVHSSAHFFCSLSNNLHFGYSDSRTPRNKGQGGWRAEIDVKNYFKEQREQGWPTQATFNSTSNIHLRKQYAQPPSHSIFLKNMFLSYFSFFNLLFFFFLVPILIFIFPWPFLFCPTPSLGINSNWNTL